MEIVVRYPVFSFCSCYTSSGRLCGYWFVCVIINVTCLFAMFDVNICRVFLQTQMQLCLNKTFSGHFI